MERMGASGALGAIDSAATTSAPTRAGAWREESTG
jgi:hypothetical protein